MDSPSGIFDDGSTVVDLEEPRNIRSLILGLQEIVLLLLQRAVATELPIPDFWPKLDERLQTLQHIFEGQDPAYRLPASWTNRGLDEALAASMAWPSEGAIARFLKEVSIATIQEFMNEERLHEIAGHYSRILISCARSAVPAEAELDKGFDRRLPALSANENGYALLAWQPDSLKQAGLTEVHYPVPMAELPTLIATGAFGLDQALCWILAYLADFPNMRSAYEPVATALAAQLAKPAHDEGVILVRGDNWEFRLGPVDLESEIVTIQHEENLLVAMAPNANGTLTVSCYRPLDQAIIELLKYYAQLVPGDATEFYNENGWQAAYGHSCGTSQFYKQHDRKPYTSWWKTGIGYDFDGELIDVWHAQRTLQPMPISQVIAQLLAAEPLGEIEISTYAAPIGLGRETYDKLRHSGDTLFNFAGFETAVADHIGGQFAEIFAGLPDRKMIDPVSLADAARAVVGSALKAGGIKMPTLLDPLPISAAPHKDPIIRRATRLLAMVHELHKSGYQRLRIAPHYSSDGWQCWLAPACHMAGDGWSINADGVPFALLYNSSSGGYFGWLDANGDDARELARKFVERFPQTLAMCVGFDWPYAGWLTHTLGRAENGHLPLQFPAESEAGLRPPPAL